MNGRKFDTEVLIAGGGLTGLLLAGLLGREGVDCIVIDSAPAVPAQKTSIDPRALALTPASRRMLEAIAAWRQLPPDRISEFLRMEVWDEHGSGRIAFDSAELCESALGYIIEQPVVQAAMERAVAALRTVSVFRSQRVEAIHREPDRVISVLDDGRQLTGRLLVAADGAKSRVRELAGIDYLVHDYGQDALACVVTSSNTHAQTARQRFLGTGPLAFLPLRDPHQCGIVWSSPREVTRELASLPEKEFHERLARAFEHVPGEITGSGQRAVFPLSRAHAGSYCAERLALAGDAAHCVHPLAGQGANLGMLDAAALAELVIDARTRGRDPGNQQVLRRYARWRRAENALMLAVLDGLKSLFEIQGPPLPWLRNTGLNLVNASGLLKHMIMRRAMGLEGDLPALARGMSRG